MKLFIVSGTSGSGKSIMLNVLEDLGYYCIDNLPQSLLANFASELTRDDPTVSHVSRAAVGIDARNLCHDLDRFGALLKELESMGVSPTVIYLDADTHTLIKRFSETRRRHPLASDGRPLADAIEAERTYLEPIASRADLTLDTSRTTVHQLRDLIHDWVGIAPDGMMSILLQSFGFKHGVPVNADFVFDSRCLPNPHWQLELRPFTGLDAPVQSFLSQQADVARMLADIETFIVNWLPAFRADKRSYLTIAIGCTGGHHRSVFLVDQLAKRLDARGIKVVTRHRELT